MWAWEDTSKDRLRSSSELIIIANDSESSANVSIVNAYEKYGVDVIPVSDISRLSARLAA
ncbi:DUF1829 domain-containing protein [Alloscardovia macacae]|uniref:DUF1829 domain-containing protein n=1 Tax=Alloscardovia macacae TaxID=1160091 RepID=UPI000B9A592E